MRGVPESGSVVAVSDEPPRLRPVVPRVSQVLPTVHEQDADSGCLDVLQTVCVVHKFQHRPLRGRPVLDAPLPEKSASRVHWSQDTPPVYPVTEVTNQSS